MDTEPPTAGGCLPWEARWEQLLGHMLSPQPCPGALGHPCHSAWPRQPPNTWLNPCGREQGEDTSLTPQITPTRPRPQLSLATPCRPWGCCSSPLPMVWPQAALSRCQVHTVLHRPLPKHLSAPASPPLEFPCPHWAFLLGLCSGREKHWDCASQGGSPPCWHVWTASPWLARADSTLLGHCRTQSPSHGPSPTDWGPEAKTGK